MSEILPPDNRDLLHRQITDIAYNRVVDRFNAFLKFKGLEEEFAKFRLPESPVITALKAHEVPNYGVRQNPWRRP